MKQFLIKYRRQNASSDDWHREIAKFIANIDSDPALKGKIGYRCLKSRDGLDYFHIATVYEDAGQAALQTRDWFKTYQAATRSAAGGTVEVVPLEMVAETGGGTGR
jgi:hypothetical protein